MESKIAIIPARGGSKRIPRKNIKNFFGKPIIAYSIQSALTSGLFDEVMVSTDDHEIAEIAKAFGAQVPFLRSDVNANDHATTYDVIEEVLLYYQAQGKVFDYAVCIYPTAPFVKPNILINAFNKLQKDNLDCVFPIMEFSYPIQRALTIDNDKLFMVEKQFEKSRSQDLEPRYHDAGQFYFFNVESLLQHKKLWTNNTGGIIIDERNGQDIDRESDWEIAELKYKLLYGNENNTESQRQ